MRVPQDNPFTTGSSEEFPGFPADTDATPAPTRPGAPAWSASPARPGVSARSASPARPGAPARPESLSRAAALARAAERIAHTGLWADDGSVHPDAARLARAVVTALLADGDAETALPGPLAARVAEVRHLARPGFHRVETTDGIRLSAVSLRLRAPGPHPLVVVPSAATPLGWALFPGLYLGLARRGHHVLAYTPRGVGAPGLPTTSEGRADLAGPHDWADGSAVVDFAVQEFAPAAVGFLGASYGAGISRLVAAHDERVDAVAALGGWENLATSLHDHGTRHLAALATLVAGLGGPEESRFGPAERRVLDDFRADRNPDAVAAWAGVRSPESYLALANDRGTPTYASHTWHESLFPVTGVLDVFDRLTVPKRLTLWIGDHLAPEGPGLLGTDPANPALHEAYAWLDQHLKGVPGDGPPREGISAQVMFTYATEPAPGPGGARTARRIVRPARREHRSRWADFTTGHETYALTGDGAGGADGLLLPWLPEPLPGETAPRPPREGAGWRRAFLAGVDTAATVVDHVLTTGQAEWRGSPKRYDTHKIDRRHALVWTTAPLTPPGGHGAAGRRVRGTPRVRLTVRSTAASVCLIAHLFDVAEDGTARIVTHEPVNVRGLTLHQDTTVTWRLQAAVYDVPAGHRLMLVVDSKDPLYGAASVTWTRTLITSPADRPSSLELPLG